MAPAAVVEEHPEGALGQAAEVCDHIDQDILDALVVQGPAQVVVVDDVVALLGPEDHGDHVLAEEF